MDLLALALAPGLAIIIFIYWKDKFDKEPKQLLAISFVLGAIAILPAIFFERVLQNVPTFFPDFILSQFINAIFCVGLVEEGCKYAMVILFLYPRKAFNEPFDGITYCVMVSMGFATIENIMYVDRGGMNTAIWRMFTAVPAHAVNGVMMGYYLGLKKFNPANKSYGLKSLGFASALHGAYDFFLFINNTGGMAIGAILALRFGINFSMKAIRLHQNASPFISQNKKE